MKCSIEWCEREGVARGYCKMHWKRWRTGADINKPLMATPEDRFWGKVDKSGGLGYESDPLVDLSKVSGQCWIWMGSKSPAGYGTLTINGRSESSHKVSYRWAKGEVESGLHIDHLCRNPRCVNPEHLEAVTPGENISRGQLAQLEDRFCIDCGAKIRTLYMGAIIRCKPCINLEILRKRALSGRNVHVAVAEGVINDIRFHLDKGLSRRAIAKRLGVKDGVVRRVQLGRGEITMKISGEEYLKGLRE